MIKKFIEALELGDRSAEIRSLPDGTFEVCLCESTTRISGDYCGFETDVSETTTSAPSLDEARRLAREYTGQYAKTRTPYGLQD